MNIVVGKLGKKFYVKKERWTMHSGDHEVIANLIVLAYYNKDVKFYVLGKSDIAQLSEQEYEDYFPHKNVIDIWKDFDPQKYDTTKIYQYPIDWFNEHNVKIDFGYLHAGPISTVNVAEHSFAVKNPKELCKTTTMANRYAGPIIHFLNVTKIPYVILGEDPRYFPLPARDLFNRPLKYLSSVDDSKHVSYNPDYFRHDRIENFEKIYNIGYDRFSLVLEDKARLRDFENYKKEYMIDIYTNQGSESLAEKKLKQFEEYIFKYFPDAKIFGHWDEKCAKQYFNRVENIPMSSMNDRLYKTKYTLITSYHNKSGTTAKVWKMIWFGIIPFCHPNYDTGLNQPVHPYLRVKSGKEFYDKVCELEANPELKQEIIEYHINILDDSYFNGFYINNVFRAIILEFLHVDLPVADIEHGKFIKESTLMDGYVTNKPVHKDTQFVFRFQEELK